MTSCILNQKPDITYPCPWQFKVIGMDRQATLLAIGTVIGQRQHSLNESKKSSGGKYTSFNLELEVQSEQERDDIFASLCQQAAIRMVI